MKKYMKPIMESESFVANEYVAACWIMNCTNPRCGATEYSKTKFNMSNYQSMGSDMYMYTEPVNNITTCSKAGGEDVTTPPDWIENISVILSWLPWDGGELAEKLVYAWYKRNYGSNSPVVNFHPVVVKETKSTNYPEHPNFS